MYEVTNDGWLLYLDIDVRSAASSLGQRFSNTKQQISLVTCVCGGGGIGGELMFFCLVRRFLLIPSFLNFVIAFIVVVFVRVRYYLGWV